MAKSILGAVGETCALQITSRKRILSYLSSLETGRNLYLNLRLQEILVPRQSQIILIPRPVIGAVSVKDRAGADSELPCSEQLSDLFV